MPKNAGWRVENLDPSAWAVAVARSRDSQAMSNLTRDIFAEEFLKYARRVLPDDYLESFGLSDDESEIANHDTSNMRLRSKFFDDFVATANTQQIRQTVILGAGFDTRAFTLQWPTHNTVFEIDKPDMINFKEEIICQMMATSNCTRRALPIDLRENWPQFLIEGGYSARIPTAWIAEGLLHALSSPDQERLLRQITDISAPGSRLAFQYFTNFDQLLEHTLQNKSGEIMDKIQSNRYFESQFQGSTATLQDVIYQIRERVSAADALPYTLQQMGWQISSATDRKLSEEYKIKLEASHIDNEGGVETQFVMAKLD